MAPSRSVAAYFTPSTMPKPNPCLNRIASVALVAVLAACGGKVADPPPTLVGQFLDGPVQGLSYRTASQFGETDALGRFNYRAGEAVTFSIGGLSLPATAAGAVLTPLDVMGTGNVNDPKVVKLLLLLQSLDQDNSLTAGIQIPASAAQAAAGAAGAALAAALTDASTTAADFASSPSLRNLVTASVGAQRAVRPVQAAIDHFVDTLAERQPLLPFVSKVTVVGDLAFDDPVRLIFEGRNLSKETLTASSTGACTSISAQGIATESAIEYLCTPVTIGELNVTLRAGARLLHVYKSAVPAPQLAPQVLLDTTLGSMTLELDVANAPITSINFLRYVNAGYYTDTVFHRVISNFMVQGGGFEIKNNRYSPKTVLDPPMPFPPIALERTTSTGLSNLAGTVAMARTGELNSATSQFFINTVNNSGLDASASSAGYAVFGRVVVGTDTLQKLRAVSVVDNGADEVSLPVNPPVILSATRVR